MNKSVKTYDFYTDPGHGWVKVKLSELVDLGIAGKISAYSYKKGQYAYLEEDCDLQRFTQAMVGAGFSFKFRTHSANKSSRIRNYERYTKFI